MDIWDLPTSVNLMGVDWQIRYDFRAVLDILKAYSDPEYEDDEKILIALTIFYIGFDDMPEECYNEALERMTEFIDMGVSEDKKPMPRVMDWEQDASIIIPAVNHVLGREVRAIKDFHWWSFLSAYMDIGESTFAQVVSIRRKKSTNKKLEKWEQEYYRDNKAMIDLKKRYTEEEKAEQDSLMALLPH